MVNKAFEVAKKAHAGQFDKGGNPYIDHPITVASLVSTPEEKATAYLHDVVEDTDVTLEDLKSMGFPNSVIEAVDCITMKKDESREEYIKRVKANPIARIVKIADLTHNSEISRIPNPTEKDFQRIERYKKEKTYLLDI